MRGKTEEAVLDNVRPDLARNLSHGFLIGVIRTQDRRQVHLVQQDYRHSLLILWYLWTPGRSPSILRAPYRVKRLMKYKWRGQNWLATLPVPPC